MVEKKKTTLEGVKILGVSYYVGAFVFFMMASLAFGIFDSVNTPAYSALLAQNSINSGLIIIIGLLFMAIAVLQYFIGRDLLKMKSWARIAVVAFSSIAVIFGVINLFSKAFVSGAFAIMLNGLIVWYLMIRKETQKHFK